MASDDEVRAAAKIRLEKVLEMVRGNPRWKTQKGKPFDAWVRPSRVEVKPLEGQGALIPIKMDHLLHCFVRAEKIERDGRTPKVGEFTPSFFHSYAASLYFGWTR